MDGIKLFTAAKIIAKAGAQIEGLMEVLEEKMINALNDENQKIRAQCWGDDEEDSAGGWMIKSYLQDIAMLKGKKQKPYAHIAIQIALYDENEAQIQGWEPSLYVMYGSGEDGFGLGSFWLSKILEEKGQLDSSERLWSWKDEDEEGWAFVLPLVKLNREEDLVQQIVEPVKKLIADKTRSDAFPSNSVALRFAVGNDDKLSILIENKP
jgi:hypothetical protein